MGWREALDKALSSKPITAHGVQGEGQNRQKEIKGEVDSFNALHWGKEIENLVEKINPDDPRGGCWEWAKMNLADEWGELMTTMSRIDVAYEGRRAGEICKLLIFAKSLYDEIIDAWGEQRKRIHVTR